ncbi:MAG TPA: hypothetical protein VNC61_04575 [Acidimicrobiales bacterium]|nr:hypothetical protein [Acidimicrobiales bacterium]
MIRSNRAEDRCRPVPGLTAHLALAVLVAAALSVSVGLATTAGASAPPGPDAVVGFGSAASIGSGARPPGAVAGIVSTPEGGGYWTVSSAGAVAAEGDAVAYGSLVGVPLAAPVVGRAATPDGHGYWTVAADGGIFSFGDAPFDGSGTGGSLEAPAVGMAARAGGYWVAYGQTAPISTVLGQQQILAMLGYLPVDGRLRDFCGAGPLRRSP